jgi:hypothetical protein
MNMMMVLVLRHATAVETVITEVVCELEIVVILQHVRVALNSVTFVMIVRLKSVLTTPQQLFVERVVTPLYPETTVLVLLAMVALI